MVFGGAAPSKDFNPARDLPSMKGKVVIVTGSSSGIGLAILQHLLRLGAKVYMAAPNDEKVKEALVRVDKEGREPGLGEVIWHELDLSDPRGAKSAAEQFMEKETRLDILINNAAQITDLGNPKLNADGVQFNMAINYLGPFVFTQTLLPLLESTAANGDDVRIVNVGSDGHKDVKFLDYGSIEAWNHKFRWTLLPTLERYKYSKLAVHLWTNNLTKRLTASNSKVMVLLAHPGAILSDGAIRSLKTLPLPRFWIWLMGTMMYSQELGAHTSVFAACAPRDNAEISHGAYIFPPNIARTQAPAALDEQKQQQLFLFTEELLKSIGLS
ncbi:Short-chain dehydrogenase [Psilocybe cubensis]|uniref:Short-chain dehydrogenase n=2 Tax=Psilocybe cubensis TaxID=181762 RepID=A0ACB8HAA2_PSICU|nr:Short-chain dehydrogenase [Psilocybe cubensis]KAH9484851.1 Short-chain dehydrogenase [Psilocybe cubensis]